MPSEWNRISIQVKNPMKVCAFIYQIEISIGIRVSIRIENASVAFMVIFFASELEQKHVVQCIAAS